MRASAHLALERGFPEISPRALGPRGHARSGGGLAQGQGRKCLDSLAIRSWISPTGRGERTWARDLVPEGRMLVPWAPGRGAQPGVTWASHMATGASWLLSVNHFNTVCLFSFTQLMLALVFSRACSRARVAEPKPVSMLLFLNSSSCQEKGDSQSRAESSRPSAWSSHSMLITPHPNGDHSLFFRTGSASPPLSLERNPYLGQRFKKDGLG